jgi:hypothetical protein
MSRRPRPRKTATALSMIIILLVQTLLLLAGPASADAHPIPSAVWVSGSGSFSMDHRWGDASADCNSWTARLDNVGSSSFSYTGWTRSAPSGLQVSQTSGPQGTTMITPGSSRTFTFNVCAPGGHSGGSDSLSITFSTTAGGASTGSKSASVSVLRPGVLEMQISLQSSSITFEHPRGDNRNTRTLTGTLTLTNVGNGPLRVEDLRTSANSGLTLDLEATGRGTLDPGWYREVPLTLRVTDSAAEGSQSANVRATWNNDPYSGSRFQASDRTESRSVNIIHPVRLDFRPAAGAGGSVEENVEVPGGILRVPFTLSEHYRFKAVENVQIRITGGPEEFATLAQDVTRVRAGATIETEMLVTFPLAHGPCLERPYTWRLAVSAPQLATRDPHVTVTATPVVGGLDEETDLLEQAVGRTAEPASQLLGERLLDLRTAAAPSITRGSVQCDDGLISLVALLTPMGRSFLESHQKIQQTTQNPDEVLQDPLKRSELVRAARELFITAGQLQHGLAEFSSQSDQDLHDAQNATNQILTSSLESVGLLLGDLERREDLTDLEKASVYGNLANIHELRGDDHEATRLRALEAELLLEYRQVFDAAAQAHQDALSAHTVAARSTSQVAGSNLLWNPFQVDRFRSASATADAKYQEAGAGFQAAGQRHLLQGANEARAEIARMQDQAATSWLVSLAVYSVLFLIMLAIIALRFREYTKDLAGAAKGDIVLGTKEPATTSLGGPSAQDLYSSPKEGPE